MRWRKLGRVYVANGERGWAQTHAYVPTPLLLNDRIRVYCAFLDKHHVGRIGFVDIDRQNPLQVQRVSEEPVLDIGDQGTFDDNGVTPISLVDSGGSRLLMYYMGWQLGVRVRYYLFTGAAIGGREAETFQRYSRVPILDRSNAELVVRSAANVLYDDGLHKMWYVAGSRWIEVRGKAVPTYNVRYLESEDGLRWGSEGIACLEPSGGDEFGFGRPFVIKDGQLYKMWYSIRTISTGYRLGYAESRDGLTWDRKDRDVGIDVSQSGWDSEMICFASVLDVDDRRLMFYNGNNYGETGFGVAVLEG